MVPNRATHNICSQDAKRMQGPTVSYSNYHFALIQWYFFDVPNENSFKKAFPMAEIDEKENL